jgi:penicillin-binding protein-related factor A (putative recombinase)
MNKKTRRKIHKRVLNDVVYEISVSHLWRRILFDAQVGEKFLIDNRSPTSEPGLKSLHRSLARYNLKFFVSKVSKEDEPHWEGFFDGIYFKFEAKEFPDVSDFSVNNPD